MDFGWDDRPHLSVGLADLHGRLDAHSLYHCPEPNDGFSAEPRALLLAMAISVVDRVDCYRGSYFVHWDHCIA